MKCKFPVEIEKFNDATYTDKVLLCEKEDCKGLIKPDIVFFGESLPVDFYMKAELIAKADLVIVMGSSLKVPPFATLPCNIYKNLLFKFRFC